jgi:tRNA A-37 threonylcarbamoyl transferase component Bud32
MGVGSSKQPILTVETSPRDNSRRKHDNRGAPCFHLFSLFCPPSSDPLGTPMPSTPKERRHNSYGLEVEESVRSSIAGSYHRDNANHFNGYGDRHLMSSGSNAYIYNGADGEQMLLKKYQMCEVLGVGSTSVCHRCVERKTGKAFACKVIDKDQIEERFEGMIEQFHMEIVALKSLNHPNIIKLFDVYTTSHKIYIVMELMVGGELFDYVVKKGTLTEAEASSIIRMVTSALVYMHGQNIIHRDLKPENLLLTHKPDSMYDIEVKIIDFGLSKVSGTDIFAYFPENMY